MRRIKQLVTSVLLVVPLVGIMYLFSNLLLTFVLEVVRIVKIYKVGNDVKVFKTFHQSIDSAFNYQSDYQLYYIFLGAVMFYGLVNMVVTIFTKMYKVRPKRAVQVIRPVDEPKKVEEDSKVILKQILEEVRDTGYRERKMDRDTTRDTAINTTKVKDTRGGNREELSEFKIVSRSPDEGIMEIVRGTSDVDTKVVKEVKGEPEEVTGFNKVGNTGSIGELINDIAGSEGKE